MQTDWPTIKMPLCSGFALIAQAFPSTYLEYLRYKCYSTENGCIQADSHSRKENDSGRNVRFPNQISYASHQV